MFSVVWLYRCRLILLVLSQAWHGSPQALRWFRWHRSSAAVRRPRCSEEGDRRAVCLWARHAGAVCLPLCVGIDVLITSCAQIVPLWHAQQVWGTYENWFLPSQKIELSCRPNRKSLWKKKIIWEYQSSSCSCPLMRLPNYFRALHNNIVVDLLQIHIFCFFLMLYYCFFRHSLHVDFFCL